MSVKIVIRPEYEGLRQMIESLVAEGMPHGAEVIYDERNRLFALPTETGDVIVKSFHRPSLINSIVYSTLRRSKARRSYEHAMELLRLGFNTPDPVAYVEVRDGMRLRQSYYVCRRLADCDTMRYWPSKADLDHLLSDFAAEMVRLHKKGVLNQDFSPGNILHTGNPVEGYKFYYVDLNRMKFGVFNHRKLMANFRCITLEPEEVKTLAAHYAKASGMDHDTVLYEAMRNYGKYVALQLRKYRFKKFMAAIGLRKKPIKDLEPPLQTR